MTGAPAKPAFQRSSGGRTGSTGPNSVGRSASGTINCFLCGKEGHWANACPTGPQCYACREWGHIARDCPDKDAKDQNDAYLKAKESKKAESKEN
ncbi:hypothetical protein PHMEG_00024329 [Phytophthora megakarya]|uniref:CCHC-type domain-containing protein n=1 Tax=Phytophthora megakarya TaxID=4795 RepID=A0A225VG67_9STRA|nr:hypothetical protein PHMEG_00024329 [Phytophthora megakarya]